jgi:hypothetical protein
MTPVPSSKAAPAEVTNPPQKEIQPDKQYVLVMAGVDAMAVRIALDTIGRGAGADKGAPFWSLRAEITEQLLNEETTEAKASGLIAGREAQRAADRTATLKEESAQAAATKTAAKRAKK